MVSEVLKFLVPAELQHRIRALPDSIKEYLTAESHYLSLCVSYIARQLSLVVIALFALVAIFFSLFNALLLIVFYGLQQSQFGLSFLEIVAIETALVGLVTLGLAVLLRTALVRIRVNLAEYISHWGK